MFWKKVETGGSGLGIFLEGRNKTVELLSQDNRSQNRKVTVTGASSVGPFTNGPISTAYHYAADVSAQHNSPNALVYRRRLSIGLDK
jgi:hypothetical protein